MARDDDDGRSKNPVMRMLRRIDSKLDEALVEFTVEQREQNHALAEHDRRLAEHARRLTRLERKLLSGRRHE
jgi:hypothetical protein